MLASCLLVSGCRLSWERAHNAVDRIAVGNSADTVRLILGDPDVTWGREEGSTAWMAAESMPSAHHARFQFDAQSRVVDKRILTGCGCAK